MHTNSTIEPSPLTEVVVGFAVGARWLAQEALAAAAPEAQVQAEQQPPALGRQALELVGRHGLPRVAPRAAKHLKEEWHRRPR